MTTPMCYPQSWVANLLEHEMNATTMVLQSSSTVFWEAFEARSDSSYFSFPVVFLCHWTWSCFVWCHFLFLRIFFFPAVAFDENRTEVPTSKNSRPCFNRSSTLRLRAYHQSFRQLQANFPHRREKSIVDDEPFQRLLYQDHHNTFHPYSSRLAQQQP